MSFSPHPLKEWLDHRIDAGLPSMNSWRPAWNGNGYFRAPLDLLMRAFLRRSTTRRDLALKKAARAWPKVRAHVHSAQVKREERPSDDWLCWQVELTYSYAVASGYYSGCFRIPPDSEDEAYEQAARSTEKDVIVRYRPDETTTSVFLMEDQP